MPSSTDSTTAYAIRITTVTAFSSSSFHHKYSRQQETDSSHCLPQVSEDREDYLAKRCAQFYLHWLADYIKGT